MKRSISLCMGIALFLLGGLVSVQAQKQEQHVFGLIYDPVSNMGRPIVHLELAEGVFGDFLIDTGSDAMFVTDKLAARLHLMPKDVISADGQPVYLKPGQIAQEVTIRLILDKQGFSGPACVVADAVYNPGSIQHFDGILGASFLRVFAVLFDFQTHRILLSYPGNLFEEQINKWGMSGAVVIPQANMNFVHHPA